MEQNIVLRWISQADLPALYAELVAAGLGQAGASTLADITVCPGTDTCKLGISSSRGLAAELRQRIMARNGALDAAVKPLKMKISGCFNSCGQHHIADIGFYGVSRKVGNHAVPHFQVVLGGQATDNAGAYGLSTVAIPSKRIPEVMARAIRNGCVAAGQLRIAAAYLVPVSAPTLWEEGRMAGSRVMRLAVPAG